MCIHADSNPVPPPSAGLHQQNNDVKSHIQEPLMKVAKLEPMDVDQKQNYPDSKPNVNSQLHNNMYQQNKGGKISIKMTNAQVRSFFCLIKCTFKFYFKQKLQKQKEFNLLEY